MPQPVLDTLSSVLPNRALPLLWQGQEHRHFAEAADDAALKALLLERLAAAKRGEVSDQTLEEIFAESRRKAGF
jgi:hypothetical protein